MNKRLLISVFTFSVSLMACGGKTQEIKEYTIAKPEFKGDMTTYAVSTSPSGVNMTYYSDIYSRGFA